MSAHDVREAALPAETEPSPRANVVRSGSDLIEKAGAAPTATGPDVAKAECPATLVSSDGQIAPPNLGGNSISINAADLFNRVRDFLARFILYPNDSAKIAHTLWTVHTHLMDVWFSTPRLAVLSPEPGSGKSRLLEITKLLVPRPILSVQSSPAYILRKIANQTDRPTILCDEIDAIFGPFAKGNEDLRAMINAGYRRGATIGRCYTERGKVITQDLPTYGAIALGGLGDLPSTIQSRSITIRMRKRANGEIIEPFEPRIHESLGDALRDELVVWATSVESKAELMAPDLPDGVSDRNQDIWGPILIVAELAGPEWLAQAKLVATEFVGAAKAVERPSLGVQLLTDIKACFGDNDKLSSQQMIDLLLADDESPWGDLRGRKLNPRELAKMLREYEISSSSIRLADNSTPKGYKREAFHDAWKRYLPPSTSLPTTATRATSATNPAKTGISASGGVADNVAGGSSVAKPGGR